MSSSGRVFDPLRPERAGDIAGGHHHDERGNHQRERQPAGCARVPPCGGAGVGARLVGQGGQSSRARLPQGTSRTLRSRHRGSRGTPWKVSCRIGRSCCRIFFDRAERLFPKKEVVTATATGRRARDLRRLGRAHASARRGAGRARHLADGRVATFAWNTARHLELYFAAPCSGRVLHTLNIRLFPEQVTYIVNHAEDEVIFVDKSLARGVVAAGRHVRDRQTHRGHGRRSGRGARVRRRVPRLLEYEDLLAAARPGRVARRRREPSRVDVLHERAPRATPRASCTRTARRGCTRWPRSMADSLGASEHDRILPVVPMFHANAWGSGPRRRRVRRHVGDARARSVGASDRRADRGGAGDRRRWRPDDLDGRAARAEGPRHLRVARGRRAVVRPCRKSLSEAYREQIGSADQPGLGDDRDAPGGLGVPHQELPRRDDGRRAAGRRARVGRARSRSVSTSASSTP